MISTMRKTHSAMGKRSNPQGSDSEESIFVDFAEKGPGVNQGRREEKVSSPFQDQILWYFSAFLEVRLKNFSLFSPR